MPTAIREIKTKYPLPSYNYKVVVNSDTLPFSSVDGLNIEYETVIYKHGFSYKMGVNAIRGQQNPITITLKRGVVAKRDNLFAWLKGNSVKDIFIDLCDEGGVSVVRWKVGKARAVKMEGPSFDANGNDVAIESIELLAHHLDIEYL